MKVAFTIATINYLAQAKALSDSFLNYNSEYKFIIFLLDKKDDKIDSNFFSEASLIEIESLSLPFFWEMLEQYTIFELSNALKPFVAEYLLNGDNRLDSVLYLDSDILVYNSFTEVDVLLENFSIILTPHISAPLPLDGCLLDERAFLNSGIYNGGFFALRRDAESFSFLSWWKERLKKYCFIDLPNGMFVDQIWLNLAPCYFKNLYILNDFGYNVAFWNFHERAITKIGSKYVVNGQKPLVFFHFSGYKFEEPEHISKYQNRYTFELRSDIKQLYDEYVNKVLNNNYKYFSKQHCHFDQLKKKKIEGSVIQTESNQVHKESRINFVEKLLYPLNIKCKIKHLLKSCKLI